MTTIYLGSASPRRKQLLSQIGLEVTQFSVDIDESVNLGESPEAYVKRMSYEKAEAAYDHLVSLRSQTLDDGIIITSDTTVTQKDTVFVKPIDKDDFYAMMGKLSGSNHQVLTSVSVSPITAGGSDEKRLIKTIICSTEVSFKSLTPEEIESYWQSGEPLDKAGGYGIQGKGALFVESIQGSYTNVVGLPLFETAKLLEEFNYNVW